jgi:hypothetical protein
LTTDCDVSDLWLWFHEFRHDETSCMIKNGTENRHKPNARGFETTESREKNAQRKHIFAVRLRTRISLDWFNFMPRKKSDCYSLLCQQAVQIFMLDNIMALHNCCSSPCTKFALGIDLCNSVQVMFGGVS